MIHATKIFVFLIATRAAATSLPSWNRMLLYENMEFRNPSTKILQSMTWKCAMYCQYAGCLSLIYAHRSKMCLCYEKPQNNSIESTQQDGNVYLVHKVK